MEVEEVTVVLTHDDIVSILVRLGESALEGEEWRTIPDYPRYYISSLGRVLGIRKIHKWQHNSRGGNYPYVNLYRRVDGVRKRKNCNVHVLVALVFLGPRPKGMVVHHKDLNRNNPRLDNLEHATNLYNNQHTIREKKY
jgi:hypothetical protein